MERLNELIEIGDNEEIEKYIKSHCSEPRCDCLCKNPHIYPYNPEELISNLIKLKCKKGLKYLIKYEVINDGYDINELFNFIGTELFEWYKKYDMYDDIPDFIHYSEMYFELDKLKKICKYDKFLINTDIIYEIVSEHYFDGICFLIKNNILDEDDEYEIFNNPCEFLLKKFDYHTEKEVISLKNNIITTINMLKLDIPGYYPKLLLKLDYSDEI